MAKFFFLLKVGVTWDPVQAPYSSRGEQNGFKLQIWFLSWDTLQPTHPYSLPVQSNEE